MIKTPLPARPTLGHYMFVSTGVYVIDRGLTTDRYYSNLNHDLYEAEEDLAILLL
jgi:hypothetical protein